LRGAGLSANKIAHLRSAAETVVSGQITGEEIESAPSPQASERLCTIRGIGPWSAAVVLLRGFGRLDVFPMKDSGVARSLRLLSGNPLVDSQALLEGLGPVRGMLYFHLLLGRMRNLVPSVPDSEIT
jgi:DNA-3-methyladenine glycosylase II